MAEQTAHLALPLLFGYNLHDKLYVLAINVTGLCTES